MRLNIVCVVLIVFAYSCKSTNKTISSLDNNESLFKQAIVLDSIGSEYEYAKIKCNSCLFLGQSLVFRGKKTFDILKFRKENGEVISFYFDVSKFYENEGFKVVVEETSKF